MLQLGWSSLNLLLEEICNRSILAQLLIIVCDSCNILVQTLFACLLRNHALSLLQSLHKRVNSGIELVQVNFHVFLLTLSVFRFFIRMEIFESFFIRWIAFFLSLLLLFNSIGSKVLLLHETESSF